MHDDEIPNTRLGTQPLPTLGDLPRQATWPLLFTIYESEEGPAVGCFEVEREAVPQFFAWERPIPVTEEK